MKNPEETQQQEDCIDQLSYYSCQPSPSAEETALPHSLATKFFYTICQFWLNTCTSCCKFSSHCYFCGIDWCMWESKNCFDIITWLIWTVSIPMLHAIHFQYNNDIACLYDDPTNTFNSEIKEISDKTVRRQTSNFFKVISDQT